MNEDICCITNKGKTVKNEWENDDSDFLQAFTVYIKIRQIVFPYLLINKERYISSVKSYKYLNKLIS